jgi:hypothetical protein
MNFPWQILILIAVGYVIKEYSAAKKENIYNYEDIRYQVRESFLSDAERSFLEVLEAAVGNEFKIFGKGRISDLIRVKGANEWQSRIAKDQINQKHVDFVVCDRKRAIPVCAIELDDSSHHSRDALKNDTIKNKVFSKAGLPLVRFKAQAAYALAEIQSNLAPYLRAEVKAEPTENFGTSPDEQSNSRAAESGKGRETLQAEPDLTNEINIPIRRPFSVKVIDKPADYPENENPALIIHEPSCLKMQGIK